MIVYRFNLDLNILALSAGTEVTRRRLVGVRVTGMPWSGSDSDGH
jgi:hypothetical protein